MSLSLRQLEVFRLLMRVRNVTETARVLNVSQPAVSASIKELEEQLGLSLFSRVGGRLRPTAEAGPLLAEIERLFLQMGVIQNRARELVDAQAGSLDLVSIPSLLARLIPNALARFSAEQPRAKIRARGVPVTEVAHQTKQETVDLGFAYLPIDEPGIAVEPILRTQLVCLMRPDHPLAGRKSLTINELEGEPLIVQSADTPPGLMLRESFVDRDKTLLQTIETNQSILVAGLVHNKLGIGIIDPLSLVSAVGVGLTAVPYEPRSLLTLAAVYSRHRAVPRSAVRFVAVVRDELTDICAELTALGLYAERL